MNTAFVYLEFDQKINTIYVYMISFY